MVASQLQSAFCRRGDPRRPEPEIRQQDHGPAAETIGQRTLYRREQELHQRPGGAEHAEDLGCRRDVAALEREMGVAGMIAAARMGLFTRS